MTKPESSLDKKAQHSILNSDDIFFRCVEDSNEPIMITNLEGQIIYVNPAWTSSYEFSREEALGQTPRLLRSVHQDKDFYHKMWAQIKDPKYGSWKGELVNRSKSGVEVPVLLSITPYRSTKDGEIKGYMAVALDLKEQKELENKVQQQDRLATIGELTSGLAHEIGTPIGVIRGRAEMLQMGLKDPQQMGKALDIIIRQTDRIHSLISTLLRLSRRRDEIVLGPVSLKTCIKEVMDLFEHMISKAKIKTEVDVPEDHLIFADVERVEQVVINLLTNSIYALEEKATREAGEKKLSLQVKKDGNKIVLHFKDTGMGIPAAILDKVFNPFFTTKPTSKGTGLGLSIVSRLMEEMGAGVSVESVVGQGTEFKLSFKPFSR